MRTTWTWLMMGLLFAASAMVAVACGASGGDPANTDEAGSSSEEEADSDNTGGDSDENQAADADDDRPADIGTPLPTGQHTIVFPDFGKNSLQFTSQAEERIAGTLAFAYDQGEVHGSIVVDVDNGMATDGSLTFPVADMRTGNELRDQHLRNQAGASGWIDAETNPDLKLANVTATKIEGTNTLWQLTGQFEVNGVARDLSIPVNVRYYDSFPGLGEGIVRVSGRFDVPVAEHDITNSLVGGPAVAAVWNVEFALFGKVQVPGDGE